MAETLGTIRGQMILDVKQALASYTQARQAHVATVTALHTGAGAMAATGAGIAGVGAVMVGGFLSAVSAAAEFEKRLDYFNAISGTTQDQFEGISKKALQLGADTIYTSEEVADAFIELGKSGVKTQDILDGIGDAVVNLGAATDIPLADAAASLTTILNTFGISAQDAVNVVDKLAGAANSSSIDVSDLITTITYVGASAKVAGIQFEDVNAAIALLGERGIAGSKAGTGLRQMFDKLIAPTNAGKEALAELGIVAEDGSNSLLNLDGTLKPIPALLDTLNGSLDGMTQDQKVDILGKIFPITSLPTILSLLDGGSEGMARLTAEINKTSAMDIASARLDNLAGDLEVLKGTIDSVKTTAGGGFQTIARVIIQGITDILQAFLGLPPGVQTAITGAIAIAGTLLTIIGTLGLVASAFLNIYATAIVLAPAMSALAAALKAVWASMVALNIALAANPLVRILAIIGLIVAAFITLYSTSETFRNAVQPIFDALLDVFYSLQPVIMMVIGVIQQFFGSFTSAAPGAVEGVVGVLGQLASTIGGVLSGAIQTALPILMSIIQAIAGFFMPALQAVMPLISAVGAVLAAVFGGNLAGIAPAITNMGTAFTDFIQIISQQVIPMVMQFVTSIITTLIAGLPGFIQAGITMFTGLVQAIATVIPIIISAVLQLLLMIVQTLVSILPTLITAFVQGLTGLLTALTTLLPTIIEAVLAAILSIIQAVVTLVPQLITQIVTILPGILTAIIMLIPTLITAAIQLFLGLVLGLVQALPQIITALLDAGIQIIMALLGMIPMLLQTGIEMFLAILLALIEVIPQLLTTLITVGPQLQLALIGMIPDLITAGIELFLAVQKALFEAMPQIIEALIQAGPQMVDALIQAGPEFAAAGVELMNGLIEGFSSMGGALWEAAQNIAASALDGIKSMLGIASPSKEMAKLGVWSMIGLVNGIKGEQKMVVDTVSRLASAMASVPMELSQWDALKDSVTVTRQMITSGSVSMKNEDPALASIDKTLRVLKDRPQQISYDMPITNPTPEKASESVPRAIRAAAYIAP